MLSGVRGAHKEGPVGLQVGVIRGPSVAGAERAGEGHGS